MTKEQTGDGMLPFSNAMVVLSNNGVEVIADAETEMVSLNDIYAAFGSPEGKDPRRWTRLPSTKSLVETLARKLNVHKVAIQKTVRGGSGKGKGGSWAHKTISYAYAEYVCDEAHIHVIEGFKKWAEEERNPGLKIDRGIDAYIGMGYSFAWVDKRLKGKVVHKKLNAKIKSLGGIKATYQQVADIGNVKVIGKPAKAIKLERDPATGQTRDSFTETELTAIAFYESQTDNALDVSRAYGHQQITDTALVIGNAVQRAMEDGMRQVMALRDRRAV